MTQDDVIRFAREAGAIDIGFNYVTYLHEYSMFSDQLEAFAKLVAEHEREACAKLCEEYQNPFEGKAMAEAIRARGQA